MRTGLKNYTWKTMRREVLFEHLSVLPNEIPFCSSALNPVCGKAWWVISACSRRRRETRNFCQCLVSKSSSSCLRIVTVCCLTPVLALYFPTNLLLIALSLSAEGLVTVFCLMSYLKLAFPKLFFHLYTQLAFFPCVHKEVFGRPGLASRQYVVQVRSSVSSYRLLS